MNSKIGNVLMLIVGFLAYVLFFNNPLWTIVGILGAFVAGIGLANLSYSLVPLKKTASDWLIPAVTLLVFGGLTYLIQANFVVHSLLVVLTIAPLARLYAYLVKYRQD